MHVASAKILIPVSWLVLLLASGCGDDAVCPSGLTMVDGLCVDPTDAGRDGESATDGAVDGAVDGPLDTAPPSIVSVSPEADAAGVDPDAAVEVVFSEALDASSLTSESFQLVTAGEGVAGAISFEMETNTARFTPASPLALLAAYRVLVSTSVQDLSGNALEAPYESGFSIRDGQWSEPALLETRAEDARTARVALDALGNGVATWRHFGGTRFDLWASHHEAEAGWQPPVLIEADMESVEDAWPLSYSENEFLAVFEAGSTRSNRFTDGAWGSVETIQNSTEPLESLAANDAGGAVALFRDTGSGSWLGRSFTPAAGWGVAETVGPAVMGSDPAHVAMNSEGSAMAVWHTPCCDAGIGSSSSSQRPAGGSWAAEETVQNNMMHNVYSPTIAVSDAGVFTAMWAQSSDPSGRERAWSSTYSTDTGWSPREEAGEHETFSAGRPSLVADREGNVLAFWPLLSDDFVAREFWWNRYSPGTGWGRAAEFASGGALATPTVIIDSLGHAIAMYPATSGGRLWTRFIASSGWSAPQPFPAEGEAAAITPDLAVDASGRVVAVWTDSDGSKDVWSARFE